MGAAPVLGDVFDVALLNDIAKRAAPEVIIHQLTSFGATARDPFAETNRLRIEGTRNLVAPAIKIFISPSFLLAAIATDGRPNGRV